MLPSMVDIIMTLYKIILEISNCLNKSILIKRSMIIYILLSFKLSNKILLFVFLPNNNPPIKNEIKGII